MKSSTILYVEDDVVTLTAYQRRLEESGFNVVPAGDGIQAMSYLHSHEPDLILLDLVLPKFDGEDVLKYVYSVPRLCRIPVIVLSTNSMVNMANEPLLAKAEDRILKQQCTFQKLLDSINKVLSVVEGSQIPRTATFKPHACPLEAPRIISFLQLNLRGTSPLTYNRTFPNSQEPLI